MIKIKIYIYGLSGNDGIIRYVGKTYDTYKRLNEHIYESKNPRNNNHKNNWIKKIIKNNENLNISILEECNENNWIEKEKFWISKIENLTNISTGGDGVGGRRYKTSLNDIITWIKDNIPEIKSEMMWRIYIKNNNLPGFIPRNPYARYKNDGWISWNHFFSYPNHKTLFLPFIDLKILVQKSKIKTIKEYRENRTEHMPYSPDVYYKNEWKSWKDFLGYKKIKDIKKSRKKTLVNYNDAKSIIKNFNFTKKKEYVEWYSKNKDKLLPSNPIKYYKKEWNGWIDFFGNNLPKVINYHKKSKNNNFLSYNDAKEWIKINYSILRGESNWRKITKELPYFIPKRPDYVYKNNGWENWKVYLNKT